MSYELNRLIQNFIRQIAGNWIFSAVTIIVFLWFATALGSAAFKSSLIDDSNRLTVALTVGSIPVVLGIFLYVALLGFSWFNKKGQIYVDPADKRWRTFPLIAWRHGIEAIIASAILTLVFGHAVYRDEYAPLTLIKVFLGFS